MERLIKITVILALLVGFTPLANAQTTSNLNTESIVVHTNTTFLITGETLFYKIYCLNNTTALSDISEIAYVEIINSKKESVFKNKITLNSGLGFGDYFIPTSFASGNYKLIAYTNWMLNNNGKNFFETDITILNPYQEHLNLDIDSTIISSKKEISKEVHLNLSKEKYSKREKAIVVLPNNLEKGNYSISIRKTDGIPNPSNRSDTNVKPELKKDLTILPEVRGEIITGQIHSKNSTADVNGKIITLSISGKNFIFKTAKTDTNGSFVFILDKPTSASNCSLQILGNDRENYSITIDKSIGPDLSHLVFLNTTPISVQNLKAIQERTLATQIENAYFSDKKDSIVEPKNSAAFFHSVEKKYELDEYDRFRTFKETIIEIVTELNFKEYNKVSSLFLRDNRSNITQLTEPCLVLVDGLQIQNMDVLNNYNAFQIKSISVVPTPYYYGPKLFNGIVSVETKNSDFESIYSDKNILKAKILRPEPSKIYYTPIYDDSTKNNRIPDYRNQLLWIPNIAFDGVEKSIPFYNSDIVGDFEIILEGITENSNIIQIEKTFTVE